MISWPAVVMHFVSIIKRISKPQNTEADFAKHIGLKEFEIEGEKFYAINYKNALKKYNKKHGINAVN